MYEVIIGGVIAGLTQLAKKFNIDQKYLITFLAVVGSVGYYMYGQYVDMETQKSIVEMLTQVSGSATIFYNTTKIAFDQVQAK